jgi:hypothetical protein
MRPDDIKVNVSLHMQLETEIIIIVLNSRAFIITIYSDITSELYLSICLSVCLSVYLSTYLPIYLSVALQPFVGPWPLFQFLDLFCTVGVTL